MHSSRRKNMVSTEDRTVIVWDGSNQKSHSPNVFKVAATRDEITLFFGKLPASNESQDQNTIQNANRIVLSPFTAKGLAIQLDECIREYESKFGSPHEPSVSATEANLPIQLVAELDIKYSFERSFKLSQNTLLLNRFAMGFKKKRISDRANEKILEICQRLGMPDNLLESYRENLPDSNYVAFGYGENEESCYYKAYLDFFDKIIGEGNARPGNTRPSLLYLGFKWDPHDKSKGALTRYITYPLLPYEHMLLRLSDLLDCEKHKNLFEIAQGIIGIASSKIPAYDVFYLEVTEEGNPRKSFDINIYKAKHLIRDMYPLFWKMYRHYGIPADTFHDLYERVKDKRFGHLAGGIDREGKDFLTIYYGVEYMSGRTPDEPFLEL